MQSRDADHNERDGKCNREMRAIVKKMGRMGRRIWDAHTRSQICRQFSEALLEESPRGFVSVRKKREFQSVFGNVGSGGDGARRQAVCVHGETRRDHVQHLCHVLDSAAAPKHLLNRTGRRTAQQTSGVSFPHTR
jgi:hypothetical protein